MILPPRLLEKRLSFFISLVNATAKKHLTIFERPFKRQKMHNIKRSEAYITL